MRSPVGIDEFASLVADHPTNSVPEDVREVGRRVLMDVLASYLAADPHVEARVTLGPDVFGGAAAVASQIAATAHALDFDETHFGSSVHAGSAVVGVLLGLASSGRTAESDDLLATIAISLEVAARVGLGAPGVAQRRGYTTTSVYAPLAAAAAASSVMEFEARQARHALALALEGAGGTRGGHLDAGADTKFLHMGRAAAWGLLSAGFAAAGATGAPDPLFGRYGLYTTTLGLDPVKVDRHAVLDGLGARWVVRHVGFKPYPTHLGVQACAEALLSLPELPDPGGIERITCVIHPAVVPTVAEPRAARVRPDNGYAARFSLPVVAALCVIDGRLDTRSFTDQSIARSEVHDLAARVEVIGDPDAPLATGYPGRVSVRSTVGEVRWTPWLDAPGVPRRPLSLGDLEAKFRACVEPRHGAKTAELALAELNGPCRARELLAQAEVARSSWRNAAAGPP